MNNTQSNKSIYHFLPLPFPSPLFFFFLVLRSFFFLQGGDPRGPRGDQVDLGQPIAVVLPDGVPPGSVGFRVYKSACRTACVPRIRTGLLRRELRCITPGVEGTRDVFVCQHTFWRLRWGRSFERSPTRSCCEEIIIKLLQSMKVV